MFKKIRDPKQGLEQFLEDLSKMYPNAYIKVRFIPNYSKLGVNYRKGHRWAMAYQDGGNYVSGKTLKTMMESFNRHYPIPL